MVDSNPAALEAWMPGGLGGLGALLLPPGGRSLLPLDLGGLGLGAGRSESLTNLRTQQWALPLSLNNI